MTSAGSRAIQAIESWYLGRTSTRYETGGRGVGTISTGRNDHGGVSYGAYQLSTNSGTLREYLDTSSYKRHFAGLAPATDEFNSKWRELAATDPGFAREQHDFIRRSHYDVQVVRLAAAGIDLSDRGRAVQDALWSTSVQLRGLTRTIVSKGLEEKFGSDYELSQLSDKDVVEAIQDYKVSHNSVLFRSSRGSWEGLLRRAQDEKIELVQLADHESVLARQGLLPDWKQATAYPATTKSGRDHSVHTIQVDLNRLDFADANGRPLVTDGAYGPATKHAIESFQQRYGLAVTGTADPMTLAAVQASVRALDSVRDIERFGQQFGAPQAAAAPDWRGVPYDTHPGSPSTPAPRLTPAASAPAAPAAAPASRPALPLKPDLPTSMVRALQDNLNQLGVPGDKGQPLQVDGDYGRNTRIAVAAFQHDQGLPVTGLADNRTLGALHAQVVVAELERRADRAELPQTYAPQATDLTPPTSREAAPPAPIFTPRESAAAHARQSDAVRPDTPAALRDTYGSTPLASPAEPVRPYDPAPRRAADAMDHGGWGQHPSASPAHEVQASQVSGLRPFSDPRHPLHALYADVKERLETQGQPLDEDRLTQVVDAMHRQGFSPAFDGSVQVHNDTLYARDYSPWGGMVDVSLKEPAPPMQETLQGAEVHQQALAYQHSLHEERSRGQARV